MPFLVTALPLLPFFQPPPLHDWLAHARPHEPSSGPRCQTARSSLFIPPGAPHICSPPQSAMAEEHRWILAQTEHEQTDEAASWVMLNQDGGIIPMPNERILYTSRPRIGLDISTPRQFRLTEPFAVKSDSGLAYITNQRVSPPPFPSSLPSPPLFLSPSSSRFPWHNGALVYPLRHSVRPSPPQEKRGGALRRHSPPNHDIGHLPPCPTYGAVSLFCCPHLQLG